MFQLNVPKKTSALIQVWASVLLIVVAVIMSFMPIITLKTVDDAEAIEEILSEISDGEEIEIPKEVEITAPGLISSTKLMIDMVTALSDENSSDDDKLEALQTKLESKEGQKAILTAAALMNTVVGVFGDDDADMEESNDEFTSSSSKSSTGGTLEIIFNILIIMGVVFGVLGLTLALPIVFIIIALTAIIPALIKVKSPELVAGKIGGKLTGVLSLPLMLMLFQGVVSGMSYGFGTVAIMVIAILSVLLSTVISRCTQYNEKQFMYINLTQGASVLGIIGFLVFFFNLLKTKIFSNFLGGSLFGYIGEAADAKRLAQSFGQTLTLPNDYLIDIVLIVLYVVFVFTAIAYLERAARRLSCTSKHGDNLLAYTIMALPVFILPTVVKGMKHRYSFEFDTYDGWVVEKSGATSFLKMSSDEETALTLVLVGIIIMLVAEIALIVLKKVLCKDMTREEMEAVVTGAVLSEVAAPAEETAPAEEAAPAEETAAEAEEETTSQN